jgi:hypothetical protein
MSMIDFESIPKRVCSDRQLRDEFLKDPVKVTERLLDESYAALTAGLRELCPEPRAPLDASASC